MNANDPNVPRTLRTRLIDACAVQACLAGVLIDELAVLVPLDFPEQEAR